ncbi:hypothetical protein [Streptomyces sp. NPDC093591]
MNQTLRRRPRRRARRRVGAVRPIRDEIEQRIRGLTEETAPAR